MSGTTLLMGKIAVKFAVEGAILGIPTLGTVMFTWETAFAVGRGRHFGYPDMR